MFVIRFIIILLSIAIAGTVCCSDESDSVTDVPDEQGTDDPPPLITSWDVLPSWTPSGRELVFLGSEPDMNPDHWGVMIYSFDDSSTIVIKSRINPRFLTVTPDGEWITMKYNSQMLNMSIEGDSVYSLPIPSDASSVDWSPDGLFIAYDTPGGADRGVYIQNLMTGERKKVRPYVLEPKWMPDGERLLVEGYGYDTDGDDSEVAIIDTNGNVLVLLTDDNAMVGIIDVSPDGNLVVMSLGFYIYTIPSSGGTPKLLIEKSGGFPSFSPDGEWIAFTLWSDNNGRLWKIRPDGTDLQQMTGPRW